ncbi:RNA-directed DNA polymerase, eukaryota [Tanacetum coccineum]|uniref:RNA-directed DNA polymerase, eukaryota n=1 Tax=Tanacetum coccineum TaxID=301880 RepID=A0ABQ5IHN7_9ASTR
MERGFLSQKGSGVRRGVKEKQGSMADKSVEVGKLGNVIGEQVVKEKQSSLVDTTTSNVENTGLNSYPPLPKQRSTPGGNSLGKSSYVNVTSEPSRKTLNFHTLYTPRGNGIDVVVPVESIRAISDRFANIAYGFFLGKRLAYLVVASYVRNTWGKFGLVKSMFNSSTGLFSFQFSYMDGLNAMIESGTWFIRNHPLILKKWNPDVNVLKVDVRNIPVWVKLHSDPVTAFSEDGLGTIATKLGALLMLDSYTFDMCLQSWGRSSYARAMIELMYGVELKDTIVVAMPKHIGEGFYTYINPGLGVAKNLKKHSQASKGVLLTVNTSGNKKKVVEPTKKVSNSNSFDVLNLVDNDEELGTNRGTSNLASNGANSSGSFWNVETSSISTTPIIDKIGKIEKLIIDGKVTLVDYDVDNDMARSMALEMVDFGTQSLLEQWMDSNKNSDYDEDSYDDDIYGSQDLPDKLQEICDNLDIRWFTFEFFQKVWGHFRIDVYAAVEWFFDHSSFSRGCNSSFIALIPKNHDPKFVNDYRPISLIGSLYKVVTKILATRLSSIISGLISDVQTAFLPNRQILDGPFIINELLSWCKHKKQQAMVFKVDFAKAYDSIRWDFLEDVLRAFGFGSKWCSWIRGCLHSGMASVLLNGRASPPKSSEFQFHWGHQRAGIFKGIKIGSSLNISHLFYADDAVFIGEWSIANLSGITHILHCFSLLSGLSINLKKSHLLGVGIRSEDV